MGTLSDIGILTDGELSTSAKQQFIESVSSMLGTGFSIGTLVLEGGMVSYEEFEGGDPDAVKEKYPAWYGIYIDGFLVNIAKILDLIPDVGVLLPFGLFDPTKIILKIIVELKELIDQLSLLLSIPLIDILLAQISVLLAKASELLEKINAVKDAIIDALDPTDEIEALYNTIKEIISDALSAAGEAVDEVISKIEEEKEQITQKLQEIVEKIVAALSLELPTLELPTLNLDFLDINFTLPLFAIEEVDGFDGIATKFAKAMAAFIAIPAQVINEIIDAITAAAAAVTSAIQVVVEAIKTIAENILEAVQKIYEAILGFVWEIISAIIKLASVAFLEISSIINVVIFFTKYFIVSMLGFLIGAGLITYSVAQTLEIL